MNRNGIVDRTITLGGGKDLPRKTVREALDFMIQEMTDCLVSGESVKLTSFGTFETKKRADRLGRNPKTGEPLLIPGHRVIVFKPCKKFWEANEIL